MTVTVSNFTKTPLSAVRTSTTAGEVNKSSHLKTYFYFKYVQIEVPQCDVRPLGKESLLCKRITKPAPKYWQKEIEKLDESFTKICYSLQRRLCGDGQLQDIWDGPVPACHVVLA